ARQYGIASITNAVGWKHPAIGERHAAIGRTGEARKLVGPAGDRARVVECNENRITESEDTGLALGEVRCGGSAGVIVGQDICRLRRRVDHAALSAERPVRRLLVQEHVIVEGSVNLVVSFTVDEVAALFFTFLAFVRVGVIGGRNGGVFPWLNN